MDFAPDRRVYVCPGDTETNKHIAQHLNEDECGQHRLKCADRERRDLWEVGREVIVRLEADKQVLHLDYVCLISEHGEPPRICSVENLFLESQESAQ